MRCVVLKILLALASGAFPSASIAATFDLPLNGIVQIVGPLPSPISVTAQFNISPISAFGWSREGALFNSSDGVTFSPFQGCNENGCGLYSGWFDCGGPLGCGGTPQIGSISGLSVVFQLSDTSRFIGAQTSLLFANEDHTLSPGDPAHYITLTMDLPPGLRVSLLSEGAFDVVNPTPLPGAILLFSSGAGIIGLIGWRRRRKAI